MRNDPAIREDVQSRVLLEAIQAAGKKMAAQASTDAAEASQSLQGISDEPPPSTPLSQEDRAAQAKLASLAHRLDEQRLKDLESDRAFREQYAPLVFRLVSYWLLGIGLLVLFHGCDDPAIRLGFALETPVLVAMISGVSLAVVGMLATILVYMFPRRDRPDRGKAR